MRGVVAIILFFVCTRGISSKGVVHPKVTFPVCAAALLHHEARGESLRGQRAVLDVLMYRMQKYDKSCVQIATAYKQYSGFTVAKLYNVDRKLLTNYWKVATLPPVCKRCEWFHRKELSLVWTKNLTRVATIGGHTFWRENT